MAITLDGTNGITSPDFEPSSSTTPTNGLFLPAANTVGLATGSTERLRIDSSGNLGLGVTPSAWSMKAFELTGGSLASNGADDIRIFANSYFNGTSFIYKATGAATQYLGSQGQHRFYVAGNGTAGNAISFTQAMTLDASGNLVIGGTSANGKLNLVNGDLRLTQTVGGDASGVNSYSLYFNSPSGDLARLYATTEGSPGPAGYGAALKFLTKISNGALAERARIDSSGNLLVGTTNASGSNGSSLIIGPTTTAAGLSVTAIYGNGIITTVNSQTYNLTFNSSVKVFAVALGSGDGCLVITNYLTTTITILGATTNIVASASPTANQLGISKSAASHVITFKTGSAAATAFGSWSVQSLTSTVS